MRTRRSCFSFFLGSAVLTAAFLLVGCSTPQPVPISEVITLARTNAPGQIISLVRSAKTSYGLRGSDFPKLAQRGVSAPVLDELQQSFVNDVDMLTRFSALGESYGGCDWCYPQPVDLANLDSGGNGMAAGKHLGRAYGYARPQGVPSWVPSSPGRPFAPQITADDVVRWSKSGMPAEEVAKKIRESRYPHVIEDRGLIPQSVSTHYSAGLKGSQLAELSRQGVPDEALNALQEKFLAEYIEFSRQRYQNWGKGSKNS